MYCYTEIFSKIRYIIVVEINQYICTNVYWLFVYLRLEKGMWVLNIFYSLIYKYHIATRWVLPILWDSMEDRQTLLKKKSQNQSF